MGGAAEASNEQDAGAPVRAAGAGRPGNAALPLGVCFFLSGAAGLAYEVVWLRSLELIFGGTGQAAATVLAAFMAGLALGAYLFGRRVAGWARPLRAYGWLEIGIGGYALLVPLLLGWLEPLYAPLWRATGGDPLVFGTGRFLLCFLVLLPATLLMGGTLPVVAEHWSRRGRSLVGGIGWLYGVNTLGAVVGVVGTGFGLLPSIGFTATVVVAVGVNLAVGAAAFRLSRRHEDGAAAPVPTRQDPPPGPISSEERNTILALAFTGFAAMALQVAWTRALVLVVGPSVYAFGIVLATFLVGLGLGSVLFTAVLEKTRLPGRTLFWVLSAGAGLLTLVALGFTAELPYLFARLFFAWEDNLSPGALFGIQAIICGAALLLPTLLMGGLFPAGLAAAGLTRARGAEAVGSLYAGNTTGAIAGALAGGFLLLPVLGISGTIHLAAFMYLAAGAVYGFGMEGWAPRPALGRATAVVAVGLATVVVVPDWNRSVMTSGLYEYATSLTSDFTRAEYREYTRERWELLYYRDGPVSTVSVAWRPDQQAELDEGEFPNLIFQVDGKVDASSVRDMVTQVMLAQAPMLLHPAPRRALVVGLASGTTAGSVLTHPVEALDVVEIEPAAEPASRLFDPVNGRPLEDARTTLTFADARSFLRGSEGGYDVIISEPSNPWMAGPANLFTREFFELGRQALADGGVFTQWVQLYALDPSLLRSVVATFQAVFPYVYAFQPRHANDLILVGTEEPLPLDVARIGGRWQQPAVRADLERIGLTELAGVLAQARLGPREVEALAEGGRMNTDDNGFVLFNAPLQLHAATVAPNDQLLASVSRGVADYLEFPGATPRIEADFLRYLAAAYRATGFYYEAARTGVLAEERAGAADGEGGP